VSRVRANLRRRRLNAQAVGQKLVFSDLVVDVMSRQVLVRGSSVCLTTKEFDILKLLATHPGRVFSREQIVRQVWGTDYFGGARSVDTHVGHIRKKIEVDLKNPCYIQTEHGVGYRFAKDLN
jgi:DNA-binding response OmpR family regulator